MVPCGACLHFIGLFCSKALTVKQEVRANVQTLFKGSSYKMPKVKNYFLVDMYFIYRYSKIKNRVTLLFFLN